MASLRGRPTPPQCTCCPYGFHIDLDFVKFAESVANGNTTAHNQNGDRRPPRRISREGAPCNGSAPSPPSCRTLISPLDSIFSDSLENIVSDFEEAFNPRDYSSDRDAVSRLERGAFNSGYLSDVGPCLSQMNRTLPSRTSQNSSLFRASFEKDSPQSRHNGYHEEIVYSPKKPPNLPVPSSPSFCTALGRTISEIKAKQQRDERELQQKQRLEFGRNAAINAYRKREFLRPHELGIRPNDDAERTSYEQGKTHFFGSKTPDMSRKTLATAGNSYQSDTEFVPSWKLRNVVQRSSSSVDMDGFASIRRKKMDDVFAEPGDPNKPVTNYAEWRQRQERQSPHSVSPHTVIPLRKQLDALREQMQPESFPSPRAPDREIFSSSVPPRWTMSLSETNGVKPQPSVVEKVYGGDVDKCVTMASVGTCTPPLPPHKQCSECPSLREQLAALSFRLTEAEEAKKMKRFSDKSEGTEAKVMYSVGVNVERPTVMERCVGDVSVAVCDAATSTVSVTTCDAASDAFCVENSDKSTNVSQLDAFSEGWFRDCASSPLPPTKCVSIGVLTDASLTSYADASTVTIVDMDILNASHVASQMNAKPHAVLVDCGCNAASLITTSEVGVWTETSSTKLVDRLCGPDRPSLGFRDTGTITPQLSSRSLLVQTESVSTRSVVTATMEAEEVISGSASQLENACSQTEADNKIVVPSVSEIATQTEFEPEPSEPRVLSDSEIADSLWLIPSKDAVDVAVGNDDDFAVVDVAAPQNEQNNNVDMKYPFNERHIVDELDDDDRISITEETLSDPEAIGFGESAEESPVRLHGADAVDNVMVCAEKPPIGRALGVARAAVVKKLLTEAPKPPPPTAAKPPTAVIANHNFVRGTAASKSCRVESKKGDSLQYIADQHKSKNGSIPSTPVTSKTPLKEKVILKKETTPPPSKLPEPIPARIPRPKISKYSPGEAQAQSPDEEAEVADRLTPLRSEMRTLRTYSNGRMPMHSPPSSLSRTHSTPPPPPTNHTPTFSAPPDNDDSSSNCSTDSEGSYDTNEVTNGAGPPQFVMTERLREALDALRAHIDKPASVDVPTVDWATKFVQHEWLKTAARRTACATQVEGFVDALEATSVEVLTMVVNITDQNENTALHYAVSHGNFDVVSVLLDTRICSLDRANKAGYTAVMLAALCDVNDEVESAVIHRLFQMGNVNAKAVQHGQTALMLAVSHGKINTTRLLLQCSADLNIQDEEGSTALMCAAEHGHKEIVKLLLAQPDIDASLSDCDSSTALSIAVENGHRDIGVLIYAHLNYARNEQSSHSDVSSLH